MDVPQISKDAVLAKTVSFPNQESLPRVKGYDFNEGIDFHALLQSYKTTGFQATNFGLAVDQIKLMVCHRSFHDVV